MESYAMALALVSLFSWVFTNPHEMLPAAEEPQVTTWCTSFLPASVERIAGWYLFGLESVTVILVKGQKAFIPQIFFSFVIFLK